MGFRRGRLTKRFSFILFYKRDDDASRAASYCVYDSTPLLLLPPLRLPGARGIGGRRRLAEAPAARRDLARRDHAPVAAPRSLWSADSVASRHLPSGLLATVHGALSATSP